MKRRVGNRKQTDWKSSNPHLRDVIDDCPNLDVRVILEKVLVTERSKVERAIRGKAGEQRSRCCRAHLQRRGLSGPEESAQQDGRDGTPCGSPRRVDGGRLRRSDCGGKGSRSRSRVAGFKSRGEMERGRRSKDARSQRHCQNGRR